MEPIAHSLSLVAVRTPTLPPATHTNSWIVGDDRLVVVDPASPYDDERARLFAELMAAVAAGKSIGALFLTHHHQDHVGGAVDLRDRLAAAGHDVPILAHPVTADLVRDAIRVDRTIEDGDLVHDDVVALFTPGHAPGHLVLHHRTHGWIIAGDLVAGIGTIVIDPREGDLQDYLDSLERVRRIGGTALMPAHGPVLPHPDEVLSFYTAHRNHRSEQVRTTLDEMGQATPIELAPRIYPDLPVVMHGVAAAQILTHLKWLGRHGHARERPDGTWARA